MSVRNGDNRCCGDNSIIVVLCSASCEMPMVRLLIFAWSGLFVLYEVNGSNLVKCRESFGRFLTVDAYAPAMNASFNNETVSRPISSSNMIAMSCVGTIVNGNKSEKVTQMSSIW